MIINLIFVALMCYYFKRKYDYLYEAQCEQSKILYQLLHKPSPTPSSCPAPCMDFTCDPLVKVNCSTSVCLSDPESEGDSDSESDSESDNESVKEVTMSFHENTEPIVEILKEPAPDNTEHVTVEEVTLEDPIEFTVTVPDPEETNYSKMSMKQLKEVLSSKGIKIKPNIRKDELIDLITRESS
jgi:hypothetical protein